MGQRASELATFERVSQLRHGVLPGTEEEYAALASIDERRDFPPAHPGSSQVEVSRSVERRLDQAWERHRRYR